MKRMPEMLKAVLVALAVAVLPLLLGEVECGIYGSCNGFIPEILFLIFLLCIPVVGALHWLSWRMADSWMPRAQTIKRAAALSLIIMKITYIFCMALALALLLISLPEPGEAMMIF